MEYGQEWVWRKYGTKTGVCLAEIKTHRKGRFLVHDGRNEMRLGQKEGVLDLELGQKRV